MPAAGSLLPTMPSIMAQTLIGTRRKATISQYAGSSARHFARTLFVLAAFFACAARTTLAWVLTFGSDHSLAFS
jgi:hypothetical protein